MNRIVEALFIELICHKLTSMIMIIIVSLIFITINLYLFIYLKSITLTDIKVVSQREYNYKLFRGQFIVILYIYNF